MAEKETGKELTGRARVRALLIDPLVADGMRFKHGTSEKVAKAEIAKIADNVQYMSDHGLSCLRNWILMNGDGAKRCFWPPFASICGTAEFYERRPLNELPNLLSWFASNAGRLADKENRLVAEYEFFKDKKRPPMNEREMARISEKAAEYARLVQLTQEQIARGRTPHPSDLDFLDWYKNRLDYVRELVGAEVAA